MPMTKCLNKCCSQSSLQDKKELLPCALSCSSMSVGPSERRTDGRTHRVLRLSRSLSLLSKSVHRSLSRDGHVMEWFGWLSREWVSREKLWALTCNCQKLYGQAICFYHRKFCPRVAFSHLPCTKKQWQSHVRVMDRRWILRLNGGCLYMRALIKIFAQSNL